MPVTRHPDPFPTVGGPPLFPVVGNPFTITIMIIVIRWVIGPIIRPVDHRRNDYRRGNKNPESMMIAVVPVPGRSGSNDYQ